MLKYILLKLAVICIVSLFIHGCSFNDNSIKPEEPKAVLHLTAEEVAKAAGLKESFGVFLTSGTLILSLKQLDIKTCRSGETIGTVGTSSRIEEDFDLPAEAPVYLQFELYVSRVTYKSACSSNIAFLPKDKHRYEFSIDGKLYKKGLCKARLIEFSHGSNIRRKPVMIKIPSKCLMVNQGVRVFDKTQ